MRFEGLAVVAMPLTLPCWPPASWPTGTRTTSRAAGSPSRGGDADLVVIRTGLTFRENLSLLDSRRASLTDEVTGLANRRALGQRITRLIGASETEVNLAGLLLERALQQLARWNREGADLSIAVNLAMPNLLISGSPPTCGACSRRPASSPRG